jgi:lauroyl/myristoyl acyltransferase
VATERIPLITPRDVLLVGYLLAMGVVAWIVPERLWPALCRMIAGVGVRGRPRNRERVDRVRAMLGANESEAADLTVRLRANVHMRQLQYLRALRPGGWRPAVRVVGAERIDDALAEGCGVILWVSPLVFADLVTKIALERFRVSHLSSFKHGFSPTLFGFRVLNRLATAGEERFVAERLVMTPDRPMEALRALADRVKHGGVVSISAVSGEDQRTVTVPFRRGTLTLADGAPQLARRTGAALLPVFTVRDEDGSFTTTVADPLEVVDGAREEAMRRTVGTYARALASVAPDQIPLFTDAFRSTPDAAPS